MEKPIDFHNKLPEDIKTFLIPHLYLGWQWIKLINLSMNFNQFNQKGISCIPKILLN
jgi:hypothetical protein